MGPYLLAATRVLVPLLATATVAAVAGAASAACESQSTSVDLERCLLVEQGIRANHENRLDDADRAWRALRAIAPDDPAVALLEIETLWWRIVFDEGSARYDGVLEARIAEAIALAEHRLRVDADDPIALYRLGDALVHSARLNGVRGNLLRAGRDGERGRESLERALALRPDLTEIEYPLGLYDYYAGIAPGIFKWISWLWFVPSGDRAEGIAHLEAVRASGGRHSVDAEFILMNIRTYHVPLDLPWAVAAGRALHSRFPTNTLYHSELVEALILSRDLVEAERLALELEESQPLAAEASGRPNLARVLRAQATLLQGRPEQAWALLETLDAETSSLPSWGVAWLHLVRGQVHDVRGSREAALAEYAHVRGLEGNRHSRRAARIAETCIATPVTIDGYRELPMVSAAKDGR